MNANQEIHLKSSYKTPWFAHMIIHVPSWAARIKYALCCWYIESIWKLCHGNIILFHDSFLRLFPCGRARLEKQSPPWIRWQLISSAHHRTYCCFVSPVKSSLRGSSSIKPAESQSWTWTADWSRLFQRLESEVSQIDVYGNPTYRWGSWKSVSGTKKKKKRVFSEWVYLHLLNKMETGDTAAAEGFKGLR